jgi:hypothetical protein
VGLSLAANASTNVVATITITNAAGTANGETLSADSDTRAWTNSVYDSSWQIAIGTNAATAAQNLLLHLYANPFTGLILFNPTANSVSLVSAANSYVPTITLSSNWGTVTFVTNNTTSTVVVRIPISVETPSEQTNIASGLGAAVNSSANTNPIVVQYAPQSGHSTNSDVAAAVTGVLTNNTSGTAANATHASSADNATAAGSSAIASALASAAGSNNVADQVATNGVYYGTNGFSGPTNALDLSRTYQFYASWTPVQVTGVSNVTAGQNRTAVLRVQNLASSNITVSWPASVLATDGTRQATVTNGQASVFTFSAFGNVTTNESNATLW